MVVLWDRGQLYPVLQKKWGVGGGVINCHRFRHEMSKICQLPQGRGWLYHLLKERKYNKNNNNEKKIPSLSRL